jgi:O-acetyl-ADP-ribose deacetylase (regulator of RNase III)
MNGKIKNVKADITSLDTDAVVNAANEFLAEGGGVCGAIFDAAGSRELAKACDAFGHCDTGSAVITPGFKLKAKYIIHAVGPRWAGGSRGEREKLKSAYKKSLELAYKNHCKSIGFPLISAGIFGYPVSLAWEDAAEACDEFFAEYDDCGISIIFAVLSDEIYTLGEKIFLQHKVKTDFSNR